MSLIYQGSKAKRILRKAMLSYKPSGQFLGTMLFSEDESEANMFGTMSLYIGDITAKKKKKSLITLVLLCIWLS